MSFAENITFSEDFGNDYFRVNLNKSTTECNKVGDDLVTISDIRVAGYEISSSFDNTWYCAQDINGTLGTRLTNNSFFGEQVFTFSGNDAGEGDQVMEVYATVNFATPFYFRNSDMITFDCANTNTKMALVFGNDEQTNFILPLYPNNYCSSLLTGSPLIAGVPCCNDVDQYVNFIGACDNVTGIDSVNLSIQWLHEKCAWNVSNWENNSLYGENTWMSVFYEVVSDTTGSIDNIRFTADDSLNTFPNINLTFDDTIKCMNDTDDSVIFDVNLTVADDEGDTIYYGSTVGERNITESLDFVKYSFLGTVADYSDLKDFYAYCDIDRNDLQGLIYDDKYHNDIYMKDIFGYDDHMIEINGNCHETNNSLKKKLQSVTDTGSFQLQLYDFDSWEEINVTLFNINPSDYFMRLMIRKDNLSNYNLTAINPDGTYYQVLNFTSPLSSFKLIFTNTADNIGNWSYIVQYSELGLSWDTYAQGEASIAYDTEQFTDIEFKPLPGTKAYLAYYYEGLVKETFSWTTVKPTSQTIYAPGVYKYKVYVTDDVHLNDDYVTEYEWIKVEKCVFSIPPIDDDILVGFWDVWTTSFQDFISVIGTDVAETVLWLVFVLLTLAGIISYFMATNTINISIPVLLSSLFCLIISASLDFTLHTTTFLILIALTLAAPVLRNFIGDNM